MKNFQPTMTAEMSEFVHKFNNLVIAGLKGKLVMECKNGRVRAQVEAYIEPEGSSAHDPAFCHRPRHGKAGPARLRRRTRRTAARSEAASHTHPSAEPAGLPPSPPHSAGPAPQSARRAGHLPQVSAGKACHSPNYLPAEINGHAPPPILSPPPVPPCLDKVIACSTPHLPSHDLQKLHGRKLCRRKQTSPVKYPLRNNQHARRSEQFDAEREDFSQHSENEPNDNDSEAPNLVNLVAPPKGQMGTHHRHAALSLQPCDAVSGWSPQGGAGLVFAGSSPGDQAHAVIGWSPGELPAEDQIAAMSYEELVSFAGGGDWKIKK